MKMDLDLMREIMIAVEEKTSPRNYLSWKTLGIEGHEKEEIVQHVHWLAEEHFLKLGSSLYEVKDDPNPSVMRLTAAGNHFLHHARSATLWNSAKEYVKNASGTIVLNAVLCVMQKELSGELHLPGC
jgi:hypothetical protein